MSSWVRCSWILIQSAVRENENSNIRCALQSHKEVYKGENNEHLHKTDGDNGLECEWAKLEEEVGILNVDVLGV